MAAIFDDPGHSTADDRELIIGHSVANRRLVVCFVERGQDLIRIISARLATPKEREDYAQSHGY